MNITMRKIWDEKQNICMSGMRHCFPYKKMKKVQF